MWLSRRGSRTQFSNNPPIFNFQHSVDSWGKLGWLTVSWLQRNPNMLAIIRISFQMKPSFPTPATLTPSSSPLSKIYNLLSSGGTQVDTRRP